jgi:phosphatidate cytidylyltransferase
MERIWIYVFIACILIVNLILLVRLYISEVKPHRNPIIKFINIVFYLIGGFVCLTLIPGQGDSFEPKIIFGIFLLVWSNDSFAYLIGKNIGKRKLFKRVSPNKTIEGFLGGLIGSIILSFIIFKYTLIFNFGIWMALAILVSVFGTIGDLIQSKFKRNADVKDSGIMMPGHGGIYDRLDSILFASPLIFIFLEIVNYVS